MKLYFVAGMPFSDELYHHGIKGQKWGVRRFQNEDGSLTEAGRERRRSSKMRYEGAADDDEHHKKGDRLAAGEYAVRVALDLVTLNPVGAVNDAIRAGKAVASSIKEKKYSKERSKAEVDPNTGLKLKAKEMSESDDLKRINPEVNNFNSNTKSNCMLCTTAYEMRRRGYDVSAEKAGRGYATDEVKKWFPKAKIERIENEYLPSSSQLSMKTDKRYTDKVIKTLSSQPDGSRGNIMVTWNRGGGHSMIYQVEGGKVKIMDGQINKIYNNPEKVLKMCNTVSFARLDNVDFDKDAIKGCVRS